MRISPFWPPVEGDEVRPEGGIPSDSSSAPWKMHPLGLREDMSRDFVAFGDRGRPAEFREGILGARDLIPMF